MSKNLLKSLILTSKCVKNNSSFGIISALSSRRLHMGDATPKEIKIPVKWGHVSGKLWGDENEQPILALHGWQDNAGTWDTLAPLLYKKRPILAVDFPGHGFSSWFPPGMVYYPWEFARLILYIKQYYKWDKISLLCHSMGSIAGLRFASLFPDDVTFYIAIDSLIADDYDLNAVVDKYPTTMLKMQKAHSRLEDEPPSYTIDEMIKIWHKGTRQSVALDSVKYLITRGAKPSTTDPNKFYFSRDSRLKHILFTPEDKRFVEALVKRLTCPTLYVKGLDSPFASDDFSVEMRELIKKINPKFDCHMVPGTHHLHLNEPEKVANLILPFYEKYNLIK
ncbi:PREDICTED: probable serine hydrolase [Papilio xuthus]|uniref:Probable serine hydrolase n=1 Tax=Papilio xuthus TaxID=66420 RepID=A0AAJ7ELB8_PAPXU|nr:PREDICTED: probable serine hydrolase [Papilio xuthus]